MEDWVDMFPEPECQGFEPMDGELTPKDKALARLAKRKKQ